jgi:energy-coupling factor transport system ATP-binding protein
MGKAIVTVKDISYKYSDESHLALNQVSLSVYEGEWLAIVGHNGSGKSTLAKILNGLIMPINGSVEILDTPLTEETVWDIRKHVGMVFQNPDNQFVGTTVKDDVAFGLENIGVPREEMVKRVVDALKLVKMEAFLDQEPHHLSGGQKQRVAIAGVLALAPSIIIFDEATSMLDPAGRNEVLDTVRKLKDEKKISVISITHDLEEASKADRIIVLNRGKVYAEGKPSEIFALDETLLELGLDIPFPVKLSKLLKDRGFPISKNHLSDEEVVNELWTLYSKN